MYRNRIEYALLTGLVIVAGLASRSEVAEAWPEWLATYAGDTLWALMIYLGLGFLFPRLSTWRVAGIVLVFAYGIELSQLYQAEWIRELRQTFFGAVVLGAGFLWSDFACYTIGVAMGVAVDGMAKFNPTVAR